MRIWKLIFCLLLGLLVESPLLCADEPQKKIGVEIETSWIKVKDMEDVVPNFSIAHNGEKLWLLEPDTVDQFLESSSSLRNLELKTYPGFGNQLKFQEILDEMTNVLKYIHAHEEKSLTTAHLQKILHSHEQKMSVKVDFHGADYMDIEKRKHGNITPQITYQLPLNMIPKVFERLAELKHERVLEFYSALNSPHFEKPTSPPMHIYEASARDHYNFNILLYLLRLQFRDQLHSSELSENVKGFTYLFLYYWASLFNDNLVCSKEPGLKPQLAVMSRVPLSELYEHGLSPHEKSQFQQMIGTVVESLKNSAPVEDALINNKLRVYKNSVNKKVTPDLDIKTWYHSIVSPKTNGKKLRKRLNYGQDVEHFVDLLSPPPHLDESYSMGLFLWSFTKSPLVEIRGYAKVRQKRSKIFFDDIQNVKDFIEEETSWFFGKK